MRKSQEGRALRQFTLSTGKSAGRNSSGRITVFHRGGCKPDGTQLGFGRYGTKSCRAGRLSYRAIEAARRATIGQFHRAMSGQFRKKTTILVVTVSGRISIRNLPTYKPELISTLAALVCLLSEGFFLILSQMRLLKEKVSQEWRTSDWTWNRIMFLLSVLGGTTIPLLIHDQVIAHCDGIAGMEGPPTPPVISNPEAPLEAPQRRPYLNPLLSLN